MSEDVQSKEISADEVLAVLVVTNGGEIVIPVAAFIEADINGKYLAVESRDDYTKLAIVLKGEPDAAPE